MRKLIKLSRSDKIRMRSPDKVKKVHLTGIKGVGMTALATYYQDMGMFVTGSDVPEAFVTDEILKKRNIGWSLGISKKHVKLGFDLLVTTAAHGGLENEEVKKAKQLKIPVLTYAEALAQASLEKETICVCGVGGKTTTCSMLSVLLDTAGLNPSFLVGVGNIFPLGVSGRYVKEGRVFICEADEYAVSPGVDNRPKFSLLKPKVIIATNVEYDHPDIYPDFEKTKETFLQFFNKLGKYGYLLADADNKNTIEVAKKSDAYLITYGFEKSADYRIKKVKYAEQRTSFDLYIKKKRLLVENLTINVPGEFNIRNAVAAFAAGDLLGVEQEILVKGLRRYLGCRRRFEEMIFYKNARFYDDYAHHPSEIKATLQAAREWFPKRRIVAIFQPHTYSRTKALFEQFAQSFADADVVALMDIYASAREKYDPTVSSKLLTEGVHKYNKNTHYVADQKTTVAWVKTNVKAGDIVLTMGAGNIFHLYDLLKKNPVK